MRKHKTYKWNYPLREKKISYVYHFMNPYVPFQLFANICKQCFATNLSNIFDCRAHFLIVNAFSAMY